MEDGAVRRPRRCRWVPRVERDIVGVTRRPPGRPTVDLAGSGAIDRTDARFATVVIAFRAGEVGCPQHVRITEAGRGRSAHAVPRFQRAPSHSCFCLGIPALLACASAWKHPRALPRVSEAAGRQRLDCLPLSGKHPPRSDLPTEVHGGEESRVPRCEAGRSLSTSSRAPSAK